MYWLATRLLVIAFAGCGRIAFDPQGFDTATTDGSTIDVVIPGFDAPAGTMVVSFGESADSTYRGVTADTSIRMSATQSDNNNGASPGVTVGDDLRTALLRFDISALPPSTTVASAALRLFAIAGAADTTTELYAILEAWDEGTMIGEAGEANWNRRQPTVRWTDTGCGPPGSRGMTLLASFAAPADGAFVVADLNADGVAALQSWIATPGTNFGFAIVSTAGGSLWTFSSRDGAASLAPALLIALP